jgi:hypothetical protein
MNVLDFKQELTTIGFEKSKHCNVFICKQPKIFFDTVAFNLHEGIATYYHDPKDEETLCVDDDINTEELLYIKMQNPNNTIKTFSQIIVQLKGLML